MSVEIYRVMHNGELPKSNSNEIKLEYLLEFLDKADTVWFIENVISKPNGGSMYLTAKRMLYRFTDEILKMINQ